MPVYLAVNNTDDGGQALVVEFPDEAALAVWQKLVEDITGDEEEPFGFRGEWGTATRVLTPAQALALIPEWKRREGFPPALLRQSLLDSHAGGRSHTHEEFTLTEGHVALLRRACIRWQTPHGPGDVGVPCFNARRPYGNSAVERDIADLTGVPYDPDVLYGKGPESDALQAFLMRTHQETEKALQIVLETGAFTPGRYVKLSAFHRWELVPS